MVRQAPDQPELPTCYTITERDFYRDAWAYTYPAPYGFPYADALAICLAHGSGVDTGHDLPVALLQRPRPVRV